MSLKAFFTDYRPLPNKLRAFGFIEEGGVFTYQSLIMEGTFALRIEVDQDQVRLDVWDLDMNEAYPQVFQDSLTGSFIGQVRKECLDQLTMIREACFKKIVFQSEQALELLDYLASRYEIGPDFLWERNPNTAALRHPDTKKWLGVIMRIDWSKLTPGRDGQVEVINLKLDQVADLIKKTGIFSAYHMNKKYWVSIPLDGSLPRSQLLDLLEESYQLTE